ncbi:MULTISPECIES: hypothetical protein [Thalassospira]|nr:MULTISPECIES: hypothetical protein [Thalassospira]
MALDSRRIQRFGKTNFLIDTIVFPSTSYHQSASFIDACPTPY